MKFSSIFKIVSLTQLVLGASVKSKKTTYDNYLTPVKVGSLIKGDSPFIANVTNSNSSDLQVILGNDKFTLEMGARYGTKLLWTQNEGDEPVDLVGDAVGFYASNQGALNNMNYTSVAVVSHDDTKIDIALYGYEGENHLVLFKGLDGFYNYYVSHNLPVLGEFRTLFRLNPDVYQNGHTSIKDEALPSFPDDYKGTKVFDETWLLSSANGTNKYLTKYDWSSRLHEEEVYGVYGSYNNRTYGFWLISPGRDYYCGDQIKQELLIHRESSTGDVVLLNMLHGTHFEVEYDETFVDNKVWGPYLWYFNDGSVSDANRRWKKESFNWPYKWLNDKDYQARSSVSGRIVLENGSPAGNVNVFLGATNNYTMLQGAAYQYYGYTDEEGYFSIDNVRSGEKYYLQAFPSEWSAKSTDIGQISGNFTYKKQISLKKDTDLGTIKWKTPTDKLVWQIGTYDRTTKGFKYGAVKYQDFQTEQCPSDFDFYVGNTSDYEWCYAKSKAGTWNVHFDLDKIESDAALYVSIAGFTGNNSFVGGNSTRLGVVLNGCVLEDEYETNLYNDKSTYRSSSFAGNWFYSKLKVKKSCLVKGENLLEFTTSTYTANYGIMWDSIKLLWN
ncbi:polysaccharide lyase [Yamadazyma tenuis]|uniref:rhamnogalacturonan endolyase n=1 Tax=Candida tenuis (strain ATCC 10573 / BCRC 21748 / CBS 615 / JCM 9827 / NBRC 10315 / NRRL Y-1498 / VKM Y-70) TaxID=590646 RepID=G3BBH9_CANTC|nr:uncharacterized protein CANTEDRAFT_135490 [Yamadazyma tenuis ATCC 10573]EGV61542.1 hypothetical protein CANTEDRAFT_135490 [Yamadazyma tenuis ATCC 10573]WEJ92764.1 polysaccharide lyase [Yamadazyma tenuis]